MYKYILPIALLALSACTFGKTDTPVTPAPTTSTSAVTETEMPKNADVFLNYTLRDGAPDGKVIETTIADVAKANNLYKEGAPYTPFEVILGTNSVIPGFEKGVASMKKGEKKMIEVSPSEGYGEARIVKSMKEGEVAPKFTITAPIARFQDMIEETVQRSQLGEQGIDLVVGKTLTGGVNMTATVTKIDGDNITLRIENKENPFYGKKLAKGTRVEKDGISFTIKDLTETGVTLDIINSTSPFAGKEFVVGATAPMPSLEGTPSSGDIKVLSLSGEDVVLELPNPHPLSGKTLYFEVEILDIK